MRDDVKKTAKIFERYYAERISAIGLDRIKSGDITPGERQELAVLESQKVRFEALSGAKLEAPESLTMFILKERKFDTGKNLLYMSGGVLW